MIDQKLFNDAVKAAVLGGHAIMEVYESANFEVEQKGDNSPLTLADRKAHEAIVAILEQHPIPVLSEEGKSIPYETRKSWKQLWIVDPLDGTKEFIKRNGEFTVNIALVEGGVPILGIIYVPVAKLLYFGVQGVGAFQKEIQNLDDLSDLMQTSAALPIATTNTITVVGSRSHMSPETEAFVVQLAEKHGTPEVASMGSSLKICLVASGKADVYPRFAPTMEWDTAAGQGIALAAGCDVIRAEDRSPLLYNKENLLNPWFIVTNKRFSL